MPSHRSPPTVTVPSLGRARVGPYFSSTDKTFLSAYDTTHRAGNVLAGVGFPSKSA